MAMRVSGINSGLDTDAIVQELVSAYSKKTEKYEKAQTKISWKQESWQSLNTKIYSLYKNVSNLRFSSAYNTKTTTVSDNTKAKVTASSNAVTGTQKLNIIDMAQAGYITGADLEAKTGSKVTGDSMLSALGYSGGDSKIEIKKADGTTTQIDVKNTTKISDFVKSLQDAGLNASFDEKNQRIFVSAKESGEDNDFALIGADKDGADALKALGLNVALVKTDSAGNLSFTEDAAKIYQKNYDIYKAAQDANLNGDASENVKAYLESLLAQYDSDKSAKEALEARNTEISADTATLKAKQATAQSKIDLINEYQSLNTTDPDAEGYIDPNSEEYTMKLADIKNRMATLEGDEVTADEIDLDAYGADKLAEWQSIIDNPDIAAQIAANDAEYSQNKTDIKAYESAMVANPVADFAELEDDERVAQVTLRTQAAIEANQVLSSGNYTASANDAVKIDGSDAHIVLNNVDYTSSSNSFTINGLEIEATGITGAGEANAISINTSIDAQGIYDSIKDFLTEYNELINEMNKLYNADSSSGYEPLTDDEKDAMSDTEIEKWEAKIKDSLLRRDSTLNGVMSAMINSMATTYQVNGKTYSLSSFGIQTLGYLNAAKNENYAYHIDGDEDDESTSGKEDKLMAAIKEDPDSVIEFMKQLTSGLYTAIDNKMKSTSLSSAYKVYNDKELESQYDDYTELIEKWEEKISEKEDYYYNQFTQMETALGKLNSQQSSFTNMLGY